MTPRCLATLSAIASFLLAADLHAQPSADGHSTEPPGETLASAGARDAASTRAYLSPTAFIPERHSIGLEGRSLALPFFGAGSLTFVPVDGLEIGVAGAYVLGMEKSSEHLSGATVRVRLLERERAAVTVHAVAMRHDDSDWAGEDDESEPVGAAGGAATTCFSRCGLVLNAHAEATTSRRLIAGGSVTVGQRWKVVVDVNATWALDDDEVHGVAYAGVRVASHRAAFDLGVMGADQMDAVLPFLGLAFRN
jgi:hypothetical protein